MSRARLALAQTTPRPGDVAWNTDQHLILTERAAAAGAGLVLFPELSLTGYELERAAELAFTEDDPRLASLRQLSAARQLVLVVGAPMKSPGGLTLSALLLRPDGRVDCYDKQHLGAFPPEVTALGPCPPAEASVFVPGGGAAPLDWAGQGLALAICADIGRPAHAAAAAAAGARLYLASVFVIPPELEGDQQRLSGRARDYGLAVGMANFGGATGGLPSAGCSAFWAPDGQLVGILPAQGAGLLIVDRDIAGRWQVAESLQV